jgi:hypothetical protein
MPIIGTMQRVREEPKGKRAQQTVGPIAEKLGSMATLNFTFDKGDEAALITSAMACPGVVLICQT